MRFIEGESLHDATARFHDADTQLTLPAGERRLALRGLLARFVTVCNTMAYAHSRPAIHRDLKPANVMLGEYGETLVVDWGLAKRLPDGNAEVIPRERRRSSADPLPTEMGDVLGTPAYVSPEQARGEQDRVGERSDVWALGAMLYAVLTGQPPYQGNDVS